MLRAGCKNAQFATATLRIWWRGFGLEGRVDPSCSHACNVSKEPWPGSGFQEAQCVKVCLFLGHRRHRPVQARQAQRGGAYRAGACVQPRHVAHTSRHPRPTDGLQVRLYCNLEYSMSGDGIHEARMDEYYYADWRRNTISNGGQVEAAMFSNASEPDVAARNCVHLHKWSESKHGTLHMT